MTWSESRSNYIIKSKISIDYICIKGVIKKLAIFGKKSFFEVLCFLSIIRLRYIFSFYLSKSNLFIIYYFIKINQNW